MSQKWTELRREMENNGLQEIIKQNPRCWMDEEINELANGKQTHFKQMEDKEE